MVRYLFGSKPETTMTRTIRLLTRVAARAGAGVLSVSGRGGNARIARMTSGILPCRARRATELQTFMLAVRGLATLIKVETNVWFVSGTGIS